MIEGVVSEHADTRTFRLASLGTNEDTLRSMGITNLAQMKAFAEASGMGDDPISFLNEPFKRKPQFKMQSRYSDEDILVYYSALEFDTAKAERQHHSRIELLAASTPGERVFFREVQCDFSGTVKDLRPELGRLPFLTAEKDSGAYDACNEIAREAIEDGLDGVLAPSARRAEGICLPVFRREAIDNPALGRWVAFMIDPASGTVVYEDVA